MKNKICNPFKIFPMPLKRKENSEISITARLYSKISATVLIIIIISSACGSKLKIVNPYEGIDWETHIQYKANLHTHTTMSDGRLNPHVVVDRYHQLGYDILAITDHNEVTYPWTAFAELTASQTSQNRMNDAPETMPENFNYENRDPVSLRLLDIQGNELSRHHHMGSFFSDHNGTETEEESLTATAIKNGITMLYHPGRYQARNPEIYNLQWYVDAYENYDHLFGMEVYNQGDRYQNDRHMWDSVLTVMMPDRPVWGYSNDDMHTEPHIGRNWNLLILPELNHEQVRQGMENGLSFFVYAPQGHEGPRPPVIESIQVDERRGTIEISATGYDSVTWISGGKIVHEGININLNELDNSYSYVRAKLHGPGGTVKATQPFGIR